jgi:BTB/POZ domain-containing protein KCTD9
LAPDTREGAKFSFLPPNNAPTTQGSQYMPRLNFLNSIERLRLMGLIGPEDNLVIPKRMPQYDDDAIDGFSIFRMGLEGTVDLSNLTLPRTYIGRSELNGVSFRNSDINESNMCWNDFISSDFEFAKLDSSDMRATNFSNCNFTHCSLKQADLRHSSFSDCRFVNANLNGAIITKSQLTELGLTKEQMISIDLRADAGPEPEGG